MGGRVLSFPSQYDNGAEGALINYSKSANFSIGIQLYNKESGEIVQDIPKKIGSLMATAIRSENKK